MNCTRCHGLMLEEHLLDLGATYGEMWACAWRCVNCGHRTDAVMQQHRLAQAEQSVGCVNAEATPEELDAVWTLDAVEPLAA